jgi:hypothetical protein
MAKPKVLPGRMDGIDLIGIREALDDTVRATSLDDDSEDSTLAKANFTEAIWTCMDEIMDILDAHFNPMDGMTDK